MRLASSPLVSLLVAAVSAACSNGGGGGGDAAPDTPPPDAGPALLVLQPGDVAEITVEDGTGTARIATPDGTEQFVLVLGSTRFDGAKAAVVYSVATDPVETPSPAMVLTSCSISSDPWKNQPLPQESPPTGTPPQQGAMKTIQVPLPSGWEDVPMQAIAVGKTAVVWADVSQAHPANLDPMFVAQFLTDFDDLVVPRARTVFGIESDLDKDGHIGLVFSPLTYQTAVAFFTQCDLQQALCSTYNGGEYLYLTPPANIPAPYNTPNAIKETLAHELSHLLHFNRKVLQNTQSVWTDSAYMIEGTGGFAQDVVGFQAGNLYVAKAGLDGIDKFSLGETLVDRRPYDTKRDGELRGGSYWFVRFLYDRAGGDTALPNGTIQTTGGPVFFRKLLDGKQSVAKELPAVTGSTIEDVGMDFYTALVMSNRDPVPRNPCFAFLPAQQDPITMRQRGGNTFAKFAGGMIQMTGPAVQALGSVDGKLLPGGVEYVRLAATAGQPELDVTVAADLSARPRLRVARLK